MSWTIRVKHTRPNTGVDWYKAGSDSYLNDSDFNHVTSTYRNTNKLVSSSVSLSENELELTKTFVFDNEDSKNVYVSDSRIRSWFSASSAYNTSNNISKTILQNEET
jgi:hypothetical protein